MAREKKPGIQVSEVSGQVVIGDGNVTIQGPSVDASANSPRRWPSPTSPRWPTYGSGSSGTLPTSPVTSVHPAVGAVVRAAGSEIREEFGRAFG